MAGRLRGSVWGILALVLLVGSRSVWADARTDRLVDLLQNSGNYRVRVQSAQSLGRIRDPQTVGALIDALEDEHPAVRAASALALGRIGSPQAIAPLRRLARSSGQPPEVVSQVQQAIQQIQTMSSMSQSSSSPSSGTTETTRYYIGVGDMGNTTGRRSGEVEKTLAGIVREELERAGGIKVAPPQESISQTKRVLKASGLTGYYIQGSVNRLDKVGGQIQAVVSIMVLSNPGRDLRMMLQGRGAVAVQGSANLSATQQRNLENAALEGAVKGAVQRLTQQLRSRP